jgi:MFS family permease
VKPDAVPLRAWLTRGVIGISIATLLSYLGHEMATAALPLYLESVGLGAAALGIMEGTADLVLALSKLGGGWAGHRIENKRALGALGYFVTALGTAALGLVHTVAGLVGLRSIAWAGRGFRGPLRDALMADEVEPAYFGRAYGVERACDMIGAVGGPLVATVLLAIGMTFGVVVAVSVVPAIGAAAAFFFLTRELRGVAKDASAPAAPSPSGASLPAGYWRLVVGVFVFGLGDFSRTFLVLLAADALGPEHRALAPLPYVAHNVVSAFAAYPAGRLADRIPKRAVLVGGYALGVLTNVLLAFASHSIAALGVAFVLSGVYIAIEETVEKATVAEMLPRDRRSLGFGVLASANGVADMASSLAVGLWMSTGLPAIGFGLAAGFGAIGALWIAITARMKDAQTG